MTILIADDHPLLLDGLKMVLDEMDGVTVIGTATNGRQLIDQLRQHPADLVLLDLNMPRQDGLATLPLLTRQFPQVKVLVFTSYTQPKLIRDVRAMGARGFLLKTSDAATLKAAVGALLAGGEWFPEDDTPEPPPADEFTQKFQLTKREIEIIRLIAEGLTTRQISERLFLSEFTVNAHRRNIARKTGTDTPVGLVNFAHEQGLV
jgi:DNA-binding NarL/FixJ family response regulator